MKTKKQVGWLVVWPLVLLGCGAQFVDERSLDSTVFGAPDSGGAPDGATDGDSKPREDLSQAEVLATGSWEGRQGYAAEGTVELVRDERGMLALLLDEQFSVSGVPGPVVVLSAREALGSKLEAQDLHLGELRQDSGAQRYTLPTDAAVEGFKYAWIFCEPFGVEIARAALQ